MTLSTHHMTMSSSLVTEPSQCHVLLNNGLGSSISLQLAYDEHTAVFISQIKKALHQLGKGMWTGLGG